MLNISDHRADLHFFLSDSFVSCKNIPLNPDPHKSALTPNCETLIGEKREE